MNTERKGKKVTLPETESGRQDNTSHFSAGILVSANKMIGVFFFKKGKENADL